MRVKAALAAAKTFAVFIDYLKTNGIKFQGSEGVRAAEQLPLASVEQFANLKDGQAVFVARPNGARVIHLVSSRSQPVNLQAATPAIEAVPAQRTQAQARRRRPALPARRRQDRIRRRLRGEQAAAAADAACRRTSR